jgi:hypothetical protein
LDCDRPTEIEFKVIVSPAPNSHGKPGANIEFECGKAKRRAIADGGPKSPPTGRGPLSRRKGSGGKRASGSGS